MENTLITYFSRKGENYVAGKLEFLPVGNTEIVAEYIKEELKADSFKIMPDVAYAKEYDACVEEAKEEYHNKARPKLKRVLGSIDMYDVIYLGFPNWCGTMPMPVYTFLEHYDFSNKIIIPFCTHEGSGMGSSVSDIQKVCPQAEVKPGKAILGNTVKNCKEEIVNWVRNEARK